MDPIGFGLSKWSKIKIDSIDYAIKFVFDTSDRLTCWLSDFSSIWQETIMEYDIEKRHEECNPLLKFNDELKMYPMRYPTSPEDAYHLSMVQSVDMLKLSTKHTINDGSDDFPLKFYWSLERVSNPDFYETFTKSILADVIKLQKLNESMGENKKRKADDGNLYESIEESKESVTEDGALMAPVFSCSNCNEAILGARYNCLDCRDYDVCGNCMTNIQHDHMMVRYAWPEDENRFKRSYKRTRMANLLAKK